MKPIWSRPFSLEELAGVETGTFASYVGVEFTEIGPDYLGGRMAVKSHLCQPHGSLHGGASVVLAETLGSVGASYSVDLDRQRCVGQAIFANHVRPVTSGHVHGRARRLHAGRRSQVWSIDLRDDQGRLTCTAQLTVAVLDVAAPTTRCGPSGPG